MSTELSVRDNSAEVEPPGVDIDKLKEAAPISGGFLKMADYKIRMQRPLSNYYVEDLFPPSVAVVLRHLVRICRCHKAADVQQEEDCDDCQIVAEANDTYNSMIRMVSPELAKVCNDNIETDGTLMLQQWLTKQKE